MFQVVRSRHINIRHRSNSKVLLSAVIMREEVINTGKIKEQSIGFGQGEGFGNDRNTIVIYENSNNTFQIKLPIRY